MASIKAPAKLPELVKAAFSRAKANGDLTYYPTQVTLIDQGSHSVRPTDLTKATLRALTLSPRQFQVRFSPALANKPTAPRPKSASATPFNPFESPENGPLLITGALPSHNLVLNKFAVVPEHFILATKQYKEQTHLLEPEDLEATYACIKAYHDHDGDARGELFAFFNSGPHSGASQPHRHIQLLPIEQMKIGLAEPEKWSVLADKLTSADDVPFRTLSRPISPSSTPTELYGAYRELCLEANLMTQAFALKYPDLTDIIIESNDQAVSRISYNLAMTLSNLVICPRLSEGAAIPTPEGESVGKLCLNGTVLAGTALVKSESEWNALRHAQAGSLGAVLSKIGIPSSEDVPFAGVKIPTRK